MNVGVGYKGWVSDEELQRMMAARNQLTKGYVKEDRSFGFHAESDIKH